MKNQDAAGFVVGKDMALNGFAERGLDLQFAPVRELASLLLLLRGTAAAAPRATLHACLLLVGSDNGALMLVGIGRACYSQLLRLLSVVGSQALLLETLARLLSSITTTRARVKQMLACSSSAPPWPSPPCLLACPCLASSLVRSSVPLGLAAPPAQAPRCHPCPLFGRRLAVGGGSVNSEVVDEVWLRVQCRTCFPFRLWRSIFHGHFEGVVELALGSL